MAGDVLEEEIIEPSERWASWEEVRKTYQADEFACPRCKLAIVGSEALLFSGIELEHEEIDEREIEYEPEYGNC